VSLNDRGFKQLLNILIMKNLGDLGNLGNLGNLGKALNKDEQKSITGGKKAPVECKKNNDCGNGGYCITNVCFYGTWA
jgi:Cys-rich repeat protein